MNDGTMGAAVDITVTPTEARAIVELLRWGRESNIGIGSYSRWCLADRVADAVEDAYYLADVPEGGTYRVPDPARLERILTECAERDMRDMHLAPGFNGSDPALVEWARRGWTDAVECGEGDPARWCCDDYSDSADYAYWTGYNAAHGWTAS